MKCQNCNNDLKNNRAKYCSSKCQQEFQCKVLVDDWLSTGIIPGKPIQVRGCYRKWILDRDSNRCVICHWAKLNPFTNTIPLVIDHIDGNPSNNCSSNLRTLCPNCDSLTSTYKAANRGNGRHSRRLRYKDGKSY